MELAMLLLTATQTLIAIIALIVQIPRKGKGKHRKQ